MTTETAAVIDSNKEPPKGTGAKRALYEQHIKSLVSQIYGLAAEHGLNTVFMAELDDFEDETGAQSVVSVHIDGACHAKMFLAAVLCQADTQHSSGLILAQLQAIRTGQADSEGEA